MRCCWSGDHATLLKHCAHRRQCYVVMGHTQGHQCLRMCNSSAFCCAFTALSTATRGPGCQSHTLHPRDTQSGRAVVPIDTAVSCRGKPDGLVVCHLPFGPTAYFGLHNCVTRHDVGSKGEVGTISEVKPNLIFDNFSTPLGSRFATILKALFPVPKPTNKRIVTFANRNDYISLRCAQHHCPALILACSVCSVRGML
jgi:Brix domain